VLALGLVLIAGLISVLTRSPDQSARVYSVSEVQAVLRQQRSGWVGRTVLVRGIAATFITTTTPAPKIMLYDPRLLVGAPPNQTSYQAALMVYIHARVSRDHLLLFLRPQRTSAIVGILWHVPVVSRLLPPPQSLRIDDLGPRVYHVQLLAPPRRASQRACATAACCSSSDVIMYGSGLAHMTGYCW